MWNGSYEGRRGFAFDVTKNTPLDPSAILLVQEEDSEFEVDVSPIMEPAKAVTEKVELSLNSVVGLATLGLMKLDGKVGER